MSEPSHSIDLNEALSHAPFLRRVARALVRDDQTAEDLLQETWIAAIEHPPARGGRLRSWLTVVLKRKAHNRRRAEARRSKREPQAAPEATFDESETLQQLQAQRQVFEQVLLLDEASRTAIHLRYYEGLRPAEIAQRLGLPLKTVKTRLYRALAKLRGKLDHEHHGDRRAWMLGLTPLSAPGAAALASPTVLTCSLIMKKLLLVVCTLLIIGVALQPMISSWVDPSQASKDLGQAFLAMTPGNPQEQHPPPEANVTREREQVAATLASPARAEGSIEVLVSWSTQEPAADIGVHAKFRAPGSSRPQLRYARTDKVGRARFDEVAAGEASVQLDRGHETHKLEVEAGGVARWTLAVHEGHLVTGHVLGVDGSAIEGAGIYMDSGRNLAPVFRLAVTTDENGFFSLRDLGPSTRLGARAKGFQASLVVTVSDLEENGAGLRNVDLRLAESGGHLRGLVINPDGEPIPGAIIVAGSKGGSSVELTPGVRAIQAPPVRCEADEQGRFEYPGNLPEGEVPVVVTAPGYPTWSTEVEIPPGGARELEVQLVPGARIAGRLLTRAGAPVVGGKVLIAEEFAGGWFHHPVPPPSTTTDEQGRFVLEGVAPGTRELNATPVRAQRSLGKSKWRFECASGEQLSVELVLDPGLVIEGRVIDAHGVGVAGWMVRSAALDYTQYGDVMTKSYPRSGQADSQGHFLIANLGAGRHELKLTPPGFYGSPLARVSAVVAGTVGIEVVVDRELVPDASISGSLDTLPSNARMTVGKRGANTAYFIDVDEASGRFEYGPLLAGNYQIRVSQNQISLYVGELLGLKKGEHRELGLIQLNKPGAVELRLYGDLPEDLGSVMICADRVGCSTAELNFEDGRFVSGDLAEGRWKLSLWQEPYFMPDQWVEIQSGATTRVDATLRIGFERQVSCRFASADVAWQRLDVEVLDEHGALMRAFQTRDRSQLREHQISLHNTNFPDGSYTLHAWTDTGLEARSERRYQGRSAKRDTWIVDLR